MKACLTLAACLVALAVPSAALAGSCAPPGNSGVDQYFETVPGAGCNQGSAGGHGHGGHGGGHVSAGTGKQLAAQGAAGKAVQRLVLSTGTNGSSPQSSTGTNGQGASAGRGGSSGTAHHGTPRASSGAHVSVPPAPGRSLLSALLHPIVTGSASGGIGPVLPIFLAGVLVLVLGALVVRRRRVSS